MNFYVSRYRVTRLCSDSLCIFPCNEKHLILKEKYCKLLNGKIRQPSKYRIILFENLCNQVIMLDLKILISITINALKFLKIQSDKFKFCMNKLLCTNENIQELSDFLPPYDGSLIKKCARFTEGVTEIRETPKYRIILFENLCNQAIMLNLKFSISITIKALKFLKIQTAKFKFCVKNVIMQY